MIRWIAAFALAMAAFGLAFAGVSALTVADTELKAAPDDGSATLAELAEGTAVELGPRQGAWYAVAGDDGEGWLRMLSVRLTGTSERPGDSGVRSLLQVGRTDATVTTGVRGLTAEELRRATENRAALNEMAAMQPAAQAIDAFAREGGLASVEVADPDPGQSRRRGRR